MIVGINDINSAPLESIVVIHENDIKQIMGIRSDNFYYLDNNILKVLIEIQKDKHKKDIYIYGDVLINKYLDYGKIDIIKNRNVAYSGNWIIIGDDLHFMNIEEYQILDLMKNILDDGNFRIDRTGVGIYSLFSPQHMTFDLRDNKFPLMTTRRLPFRHIFEELMWFLKGDTNVQTLRDKNIHIWDSNTNREFLDKNNLNYKEWDMGPSYSFQFRYAGVEYNDCNTDYSNKGGIDQLDKLIYDIKHNPASRRLIINLWNVKDINKMALPPCGFCYQFYVSEIHLDLKVIQRSSDIALAGGWNIASAALFLKMVARVCGLVPRRLIWDLGDVHIYKNQVEQVKQQLKEMPLTYPLLTINSNAPAPHNKKHITEFTYKDFELISYSYAKKISISMNS